MDSVLATVSGYHGIERFNLIKLISRAGASYVGNMNKSITHLVCWKFDGRKYEFAKKFKIVIVNHCWIEECVKQGRRVPEEPFTLRSGQEMGPLRLDIILETNQVVAQSKTFKKNKEFIIDVDVECEDVNDAPWSDLIPLDETRNINGSCGLRRKTIKRNSGKDLAFRSRSSRNDLSRSKIMELEEPSSSQPAHDRLRKRNSNSSEAQPRCRRLIRKHGGQNDLPWISNSDEEVDDVEVLPQTTNQTYPSIPRNKCDIRRFMSKPHSSNQRVGEVEGIENANDENQNGQVHVDLSSSSTSELPESVPEDSTSNDLCNKPTSTDLSCVICWTDYSSTRGVLQCGHRFCFSCIQNWADHMASRRKPSTCPLCKASFMCITKVDDAASSDQKIYSQTIAYDSSKTDLYIVSDENSEPPTNRAEQVCCRCYSREPEDLLVRCNFCHVRCVHTYCLDPPLLPWTCIHCKDLQMLYHHNR